MPTTYENWVKGRSIAAWGTNAGARSLPFQDWRRFKEAFAPELVARAITESPIKVKSCLDPFAGSGTTALTCQFLGVHPTTIEVNPYLADLVEAKVSSYDSTRLINDYSQLFKRSRKPSAKELAHFFDGTPPTLVEPGVKGRWILDYDVAVRLAQLRAAIENVSSRVNRRLFKVLLGGVIVELSNVVISGKGRRYRKEWQNNSRNGDDLDNAFSEAVERAIKDIITFENRSVVDYTLLRGDCRFALKMQNCKYDLAVFSPPYPNSFDYTDVYNVELWAMGYLKDSKSNTRLRRSTFSSHVQIRRDFPAAPTTSNKLAKTLNKLTSARQILWDKNIPEMVGAYFAEMAGIIGTTAKKLNAGGQLWMVVGDSKYAGIRIPVAQILSELAPSLGCQTIHREPFRSMRTSPQQGGDLGLDETLLILAR